LKPFAAVDKRAGTLFT